MRLLGEVGRRARVTGEDAEDRRGRLGRVDHPADKYKLSQNGNAHDQDRDRSLRSVMIVSLGQDRVAHGTRTRSAVSQRIGEFNRHSASEQRGGQGQNKASAM